MWFYPALEWLTAGTWQVNPLQYSCMGNPMDRGGWWATVHRIPKNRTQLKWLSTHVDGRCLLFPSSPSRNELGLRPVRPTGHWTLSFWMLEQYDLETSLASFCMYVLDMKKKIKFTSKFSPGTFPPRFNTISINHMPKVLYTETKEKKLVSELLSPCHSVPDTIVIFPHIV